MPGHKSQFTIHLLRKSNFQSFCSASAFDGGNNTHDYKNKLRRFKISSRPIKK
ncbi:hypothetical protein D1AOALGA4SA_13144 [Olavius algarvensis Delta 1 endosymbiont]|nr:hypothetical protein D1AOALGA4SA_13144 [Olavius algarvensis Delta 1 endosymbiont]